MLTIIGGSHLAGKSRYARDKYMKDAKTPPLAWVYMTEEWPAKHARRELEDIDFTKAYARWLHHPHVDALVITARIANSNVHWLIDDGSIMDILFLDVYKWMGLAKNDLKPVTFPLYEFKGDHVVPKGTTKLAVTVGEHPQTSIAIADFLVVNCSSAINGIIGRSFLKALKVVTSIYHLTMKFPTIERIGEVRGN